MWEPWEFREEDLDLQACHRKGIPVLGTNEKNPKLNIFKYVGMLAIKLLLEKDIEIFNSKIITIGTGIFGDVIEDSIRQLGGCSVRLTPQQANRKYFERKYGDFSTIDAIVLAEHRYKNVLVGKTEGIPCSIIKENNIPLIHICGNVNYEDIKMCEIDKWPKREVSMGNMTVTTAYVGPKPVIDLHSAGLKVGELLIDSLKSGASLEQAKENAVRSGWALDFN